MCQGGPTVWPWSQVPPVSSNPRHKTTQPCDFWAFPGCLQRTGSSCVSIHPGVFCKSQAASKDEAGGIRSFAKEGKAR